MRSYLAFLTALLPSAFAATYSLSDTYIGQDFLTGFSHQAIQDPTHGRVNYVDQNTALAHNLTYATDNTLILRADFTTFLDPNGSGRNSVRIQSNRQYTTHVVVLDVPHMPQGCGTWPAFWEVGNNWPSNGETDITEGVNDQGADQITLHTSPGCTMPSSRGPMTGTAGNDDCEGNNGCGVQATGSANSYGPSFNANGGGWYTMERNDQFIKVWFWPRNANNVPADVRNGFSTVNTDGWGTPVAYFPNTQCNLDQFFGPHNIIINLTFCGDWAGSVYPSSCPSTCIDFVNNNPSVFVNAYWQISSLRIYENPNGTGTGTATPPPPPSSNAVRIHPDGNTAKCLDVQTASFANGTPVQIYDCNGSNAQKWIINHGTTTVQVAGTDFCLDAGETPSDGTQMKIWQCFSGLPQQTWFYTDDNRISLQNQGQCLDDTNGSINDGNIVQIWQCTDNDVFQVWTIS